MIRKLHLIVFLSFVSFTCDEIESLQDNPLDPSNPDYTPPTIAMVSGATDGETIETSTAIFSWYGNENVTEYRWNFDNGSWTEWVNQTMVAFTNLDEGTYIFSVQGRYDTGDTSSVLTINFEVDAVQGPALMFYPRVQFPAIGQNNVTFQILAEEVENLTAAEFSIIYNNSLVEIASITQGAMFGGSGQSIFHTDYDNSQGTLSVLMGMLGGNNPSVSGTGVLAEVTLGILSGGSSNLSFTWIEFKDPQNNVITVNESVNGRVVVE